MMRFVEPFLQDTPEPRGSELFAKPAFTGLPSPAHQDNYLFCIIGGNALTVWVALDPASEENGGVFYFDGSHLSGLVEHKKSFAPGTSQMVDEDTDLSKWQRVTPVLERGDVLVHHSETIHGSNSNPSPQRRRGWTMQYKAQSASYDEFKKLQYERELDEQLASRGKLDI
jgi:ectoine hydroxylase-related dioxygenase (phytanoyl-CoA dioxygenase family)